MNKEKVFEDIADKFLEDDSFYEKEASDLVSAQMLKERHREEIKNSLQNQELKEAIAEGFYLIRRDIIEVLAEEELEPFYEELKKINREALIHPSERVLSLVKDRGRMLTLQEVFDVSDDCIRKIYALGYQYYQKKNYLDAIAVFTIVTTFNPFVSDFWNALALCYQATQRFELAVDSFAIACATNEKGVSSRISRAECCLSLNRDSEAMENLEVASQIVEKNPALDAEWGAYIKELKGKI